MTFNNERLRKEDIAKEKVKQVLKDYGCKILDMGIPSEFSITEFSPSLKLALKEMKSTKFDMIVARENEHYLCEVKYKSKEMFKTWVDRNSYDVYWEIVKTGMPFLYFIYVGESGKVYRHEVTDPQNFERDEDNRGIAIYYLPEASIHEIRPDWAKHLDMWLTLKNALELWRALKYE